MSKPKWKRALGATLWYVISIPLTFIVLITLGAPFETIGSQPKIAFAYGSYDLDPSGTYEGWTRLTGRLLAGTVVEELCQGDLMPQSSEGLRKGASPQTSFVNMNEKGLSTNSLQGYVSSVKTIRATGETCNLAKAIFQRGYLDSSDFQSVTTDYKDLTSAEPVIITDSNVPSNDNSQERLENPPITQSYANRIYWQPEENTWQWFALWAQGTLLVLGVLWIAYLLRQLWLSARKNDLLTKINSKRVFGIGIAITVLAVFYLAVSSVIAHQVYSQTEDHTGHTYFMPFFEDRIELLIAGVLVLLIAKVMQAGARLKHENELTV